MTNHLPCTYGSDRDRAMVDYLYGECDPGARTAFESHLVTCTVCAREVASLRGVRQALAGWAPPEPMRALDHSRMTAGPRLSPATRAESTAAAAPVRRAGALTALPAWVQAAAAVLCVGVALGAANLRVAYSADGLIVTTGWLAVPASPRPADDTAPGATQPASGQPWQPELTALAQQLREEMKASVSHASGTSPASAVAADEAAHDAALLRQVKALIQRSEERQQQETAVRLSAVLSDIQVQRRGDLARIERTIGVVQNNTGMEVLRQQQMINSLAVRVSAQR